MTSRKAIGTVAVLIPFWFLAVYLIMAGLRSDYSYLTKAVSELGSIHAPHRWYWNVFGYIVPGLGIALLGVGLEGEFREACRVISIPAFAVVASGLFMTLSGVFPGDLVNRDAPTMIMHEVGGFGCYLCFLIAGFWLPFVFRKHRDWRWLAWLSLALVLATFPLGYLERGPTPGLGQRLVFTCYFLWIGMVGYALRRSAASAHSVDKVRGWSMSEER